MTILSQGAEVVPAVHYYSWFRALTDDSLSPEFFLIAACCRWPPSKARNAAIRAAAAGVTDWDHFLWHVKRQRVVGLVHDSLIGAAIDIPAPIAEELASHARKIARENLALAAETFQLQHALVAAGIPALALKGIALAHLVYGSVKSKQTRDLDLLVPPAHAEAAMQVLEREGYALSSPAKHLSKLQRHALVCYAREVEFIHPGKKCVVELQWHAADNPLLLQGVDACSAPQSVAISDGISIRTLQQEDLFAYLCVHGAHHAWSRLKWLADVNAFIAINDADVVRLYRYAQRIGAGLCAGQALLLCHRLFSLRLPAALADEIGANKRAAKLVAIALNAMTAPHAETEVDGGLLGVARVVWRQFLLGQGWAFYAAQIRVASVGPADVVRFPLPSSLHLLYPLLRLPTWLWRRHRTASRRK
jgi:Uncharacterised nucleotidyltransferase